MIWNDLFAACALVLVVEGMLPFLKPERWRRFINTMTRQSDQALRIMGLASMLLGVVLLYTVR